MNPSVPQNTKPYRQLKILAGPAVSTFGEPASFSLASEEEEAAEVAAAEVTAEEEEAAALALGDGDLPKTDGFSPEDDMIIFLPSSISIILD